MERLVSSQLRTVLAALREIGAAHDIDSFPDRMMGAVAQLVAADSISYNDINPARRRMIVKMSPPVAIPSGGPDYFVEHIDEHPVIEYTQKTGYRRPLMISDFLSQHELHRRGIYAVIFAPMGVEDQLAFSLPTHPSTVVGVALNRGSRSFDERDRLMLDLIRPHLAEAYRTADLFSRLSTAFDLARVGVITLDEQDRVLDLNDLAESWLSTYFGNGGPRWGSLPEALARWVQRQQSFFDEVGDVPPPSPPMIVVGEKRQLSIRFIRGGEPGSGAMLLLEERGLQPARQRLLALGLTAREIEVLQCVERGQSDLEVARELGLSPATVKKHLEHVYRKLGVSSRTAALAQVRA